MIEAFAYQQNDEQIKTPELATSQPYVVSGDIKLLLKRWADKNNVTLPSDNFFTDLREEFNKNMQQIFPGYEFVEEEEIMEGLKENIGKSTIPTVSMDGVYYPSSYKIDITRHVDTEKQPKGLWKRPGSPILFDQFTILRNNLAAVHASEVAIVDDVLFEGRQIGRIIPILEQRVHVHVPTVFTAITIGDGEETLRNMGVDVKSVRTYKSVVDQICERDFYPGVPQSGRTVKNFANDDIGAPYLNPFGNPHDWATIPKEWEKDFSEFCIEQSIRLYEGIEAASGKLVTCSDLERKVIGLPHDETRIVDALRQTLSGQNML